MKTIKNKIMVSAVAIFVISMLIITAFSTVASYRATLETTKSNMTETISIIARRIEWEIKAYKNVAFDTGSNSKMADPSVSLDDKKAIIQAYVDEYGFERGNLIGTDGISLIDGNNYSDREYFAQAMKGNTSVSEPVVSRITGKITLIVAAPLWKDGIPNTQPIGAVYFVPNEEFLNNIMRDINISENSNAYMIDKDGNTVANVDIDKVKYGENIENNAKTDSKYTGLADINFKVRHGQTGFDDCTYMGERQFAAYAPIGETNEWSVVVYAPAQDLLKRIIIVMLITAIIFILTVVVSSFNAMHLGKSIGNPIKECTKRIEKLAKGDLTSPVPEINTKDETGVLARTTKKVINDLNNIIADIGYMLSEMANGNFDVKTRDISYYAGDFYILLESVKEINGRLSDTLTQINVASDQVSTGADQIAAGAQALSQGATEQAASVEELAATIHDISDHVTENSKNCDSAEKLVGETTRDIQDANAKMKRLKDAMENINKTSGKIGKIVKTIEDISFQTNILALNAAVEASSAGEAGKGFAVVAEEVGTLAARSADATQNTADLLEEALNAVKVGIEIAADTANAMSRVEDRAESVDKIVVKIADASEHQAAMLSQVAEGMGQISAVVQTNSATAEESAAASDELSGQSNMLKELVDKFKIKRK